MPLCKVFSSSSSSPFLPSATKWIWREGGPSLLTFLLGRHEPKAGRGKQRRDFLDIFFERGCLFAFPVFFFTGEKEVIAPGGKCTTCGSFRSSRSANDIAKMHSSCRSYFYPAHKSTENRGNGGTGLSPPSPSNLFSGIPPPPPPHSLSS